MYVLVLWTCVWLTITCVKHVSCNKIDPFSNYGDVYSNILIHCLQILNMNGQCNKYNISIKLTCIVLYLLIAHPVYWNMCLNVYKLQNKHSCDVWIQFVVWSSEIGTKYKLCALGFFTITKLKSEYTNQFTAHSTPSKRNNSELQFHENQSMVILMGENKFVI